ncbi:metal-dependent hydrolase [Kordiimonas aquimaris]|uniref:metal-dependent hydrolase n=1 Tax=Kordiimonas aquimaris TaxID=707591 RepID=UPI0021D25438|nr:metal-dependent hydrolase [Kordiimonas aquimaris]
MASIFSHVLIPVAARMGLGSSTVSNRLLLIAALASIIPDADVIAFAYGIPYGDALGHRGFTHSITFALLCGLATAVFAEQLNTSKKTAFILVFISTISHGLLDSLTNGGLGIAFFWPLDNARYFLPWHPIEVSPIGIRNFFTARGLTVLRSEFVWVFVPAFVSVIILRVFLNRPQTDQT